MEPSRRQLLAGAAASLSQQFSDAQQIPRLNGRVHHSVCKWCFGDVSIDELCRVGRSYGLMSVELLGPADWPVVKKYGLRCAMASRPIAPGGMAGITRAFNRLEHHDQLEEIYTDYLQKAAAAGVENIICFSGNRDGLPDQKGVENCAAGLKRLMSLCERLKVNLVMELLNSKVNHPDYQCDHTEWGVELCKRVGSERFKLLYDIYHMQIMEGDVIATIRRHHEYIAHYHTGGVPGRHEIDDSQELFYPAVMKAIVETGYKGFVGQEFVPARPDKLESLRKCVGICDV